MLAAPSVPHCPSILVCSWVLAACVWCLLLKTGVRVCTVGPARTLRCLAAWMVPLPRAGWLGRAVGVLRVLVSLCLSLLTSCPCPAPGARAVACRLGWSHGTAEPAMVEAPGPSPLPHGEHERGVSRGGWMQLERCSRCLCCPHLPWPTWVLLYKSSLADDWISAIVCTCWSVADKMKLCLQTPIGTNSTLK